MSRHRGAKHRRRYELLGGISLLSPEYLLSVERWPFHTEPPDHYDLLSYLLDLSSRSQAPLCHCTHCLISDQAEGTFVLLRYSLGGDRPSQTTHQTLSPTRITDQVRTSTHQGGISRSTPRRTGVHASKSPTYPTQIGSKSSAKL
jgi:hypothetical protein